MKILQINKFFFLKGGTERYFFDLAELLAANGHQVSAWSTRHNQNFAFPGQNDFAEFSDFSKKEQQILDLMADGQIKSIDYFVEKLDYSVSETISYLMGLILKNVVIEEAGGYKRIE